MISQQWGEPSFIIHPEEGPNNSTEQVQYVSGQFGNMSPAILTDFYLGLLEMLGCDVGPWT